MENVWFTADTHFGHKFVAGKRGFESVEAHDEYLINNWNSAIKKGDRVYHLGDFSLAGSGRCKEILQELHGMLYFIRGNHDNDLDAIIKTHPNWNKIVWIKDYHFLKLDGHQIALSHYPFLTWRNRCHGSWCLHGHCHGSLDEWQDPLSVKRVDVGVDKWLNWPAEWIAVKHKMMCKPEYEEVNHHNREHYKEEIS